MTDAPTDPLHDDSPEAWDQLVRAIGPATMLACIGARLGDGLKARLSAEDIWQDALLVAWRSRAQCEWRGIRAYRRYMLSVIENRIRDSAGHFSAQKRGSGRLAASIENDSIPPPVVSTTPSRVASYAEEASALRKALDELPEDLRAVVFLRIFEERSVKEVAEELELGESAVKHRLRRGAALFKERLGGARE